LPSSSKFFGATMWADLVRARETNRARNCSVGAGCRTASRGWPISGAAHCWGASTTRRPDSHRPGFLQQGNVFVLISVEKLVRRHNHAILDSLATYRGRASAVKSLAEMGRSGPGTMRQVPETGLKCCCLGVLTGSYRGHHSKPTRWTQLGTFGLDGWPFGKRATPQLRAIDGSEARAASRPKMDGHPRMDHEGRGAFQQVAADR